MIVPTTMEVSALSADRTASPGGLLRSVPQELKHALYLFAGTRLVLTLIGLISHAALDSSIGKQYVWHYSRYLWLNIWGIWDTGWYLDIATQGYSAPISTRPETLHQANYGFFPLYPVLVRLLGFIVRDNFLAGILLSSACLITTGVFLFRLVAGEAGGQTAGRALKCLFLMPTAYILSAALTESLFLMLCVMAFCYARQCRWPAVGILGFLAALTRSPGFLLIIPLLWMYLASCEFRPRRIRPDILWLLLVPLGTLSFALFCWRLTGDLLAYAHIQESGWGHTFTNPFAVLYNSLRASDTQVLVEACFPAAALLALAGCYPLITSAELLYALVFIVAPLATGTPAGSPRYLVTIFPLAIIFARLGERREVDAALTIALALIQGALMVFWCTGFYFLS